MAEQLSHFLSRRQANRLLRLTVQERELTIPNGHAAGLRFNVGRSNWRAAFGRYELSVQRVILENISDGEVFYDIGANVGFFSVLAARHVGRSGRVVAFEPGPGNAALLRRNAEINGLTHVSLSLRKLSPASRDGQCFCSLLTQ
jgi:hypothetical protein